MSVLRSLFNDSLQSKNKINYHYPKRLIGKQSEREKIQGGRVTWKFKKCKVKGEKYRRIYKYIGNIEELWDL